MTPKVGNQHAEHMTLPSCPWCRLTTSIEVTNPPGWGRPCVGGGKGVEGPSWGVGENPGLKRSPWWQPSTCPPLPLPSPHPALSGHHLRPGPVATALSSKPTAGRVPRSTRLRIRPHGGRAVLSGPVELGLHPPCLTPALGAGQPPPCSQPSCTCPLPDDISGKPRSLGHLCRHGLGPKGSGVLRDCLHRSPPLTGDTEAQRGLQSRQDALSRASAAAGLLPHTHPCRKVEMRASFTPVCSSVAPASLGTVRRTE